MKNNIENISHTNLSAQKTKNFSRLFRKRKRSSSLSKNEKCKFPKISYLKSESKFIFDQESYLLYFFSLNNKNNIKLSKDEFEFLKSKISELKLLKNDDNNNSILNISIDIFHKINSYLPLKENEDPVVMYIKNLIESQSNRANLSVRKIANQYYEDKGVKISKTKVHNILRSKLNYRFLKTVIKNDKINENKNIIISLCFIKLIIKLLKLNLKLIYVDETMIQSNNNNYKTWKNKDQGIFYNLKGAKKKFNCSYR